MSVCLKKFFIFGEKNSSIFPKCGYILQNKIANYFEQIIVRFCWTANFSKKHGTFSINNLAMLHFPEQIFNNFTTRKIHNFSEQRN